MTTLAVARRTASRGSRPGLWAATLFLGLVVLAAIAPGLLVDGSPSDADALSALQAPGAGHLFGTDANGRDVLVRIVHGARPSLLTGFGATALAVVVGTALGLLAGLGGQVLDQIVMRLADVVLSLPTMLLALLVIAVVGPGTVTTVYAIALYTAPGYARLVRVQTLVVRRSEYVEAAASLGQSRRRLIVRHITPNVFAPLAVLSAIEVGIALIAASALSFLGFGPPPPAPEWGAMLAGGRDYFAVAWWVAVFPGLAITLTVLSVTAVGRTLQWRSEGRRA